MKNSISLEVAKGNFVYVIEFEISLKFVTLDLENGMHFIL